MAVEHDRPAARPSTGRPRAAPQGRRGTAPSDRRGRAGRPSPEAALVVGLDVEAGGGKLVADVLVAAGVLGDPVDEEDAIAHAGPGSAGQCRTRSSVPSADGAWLTIGRHRRW